MHILLTRPLDDSKELILKFSSMKHKVSHLPLLQIKKKEISETDFKQFKAIIFTSANAIKNLDISCLLYTSPSPRDRTRSRMPSSA